MPTGKSKRAGISACWIIPAKHPIGFRVSPNIFCSARDKRAVGRGDDQIYRRVDEVLHLVRRVLKGGIGLADAVRVISKNEVEFAESRQKIAAVAVINCDRRILVVWGRKT